MNVIRLRTHMPTVAVTTMETTMVIAVSKNCCVFVVNVNKLDN